MPRVTLLLAAAALGGALWLGACSGADTPLQDPPAAAITPSHTVLTQRSTVSVAGTQQGEAFTGRFGQFDARIDFNESDLAASRVRVELPLAALDLGNADRNDAAPGKAWFDARLHPTAVFQSDNIRRDGSGYVADGTLTIKGFKRPVLLPFTLESAGEGLVRMRGSVVLDRTRWGLGEAPWDTEEFIAHAVSVDVDLLAEPID